MSSLRLLPAVAASAAALTLCAGTAAAADTSTPWSDLLRIRGGQVATEGSHPYAALLEIRSGARVVGYCSGALVGARWVATAAHCVTDMGIPGSPLWPDLAVTVTLGAVDRTDPEVVAQRIPASAAIVHPGFDVRTTGLVGDVALVRLDAPAPNPPLALFAPGDPEAQVAAGTPATIVGWGLEGPQGTFLSVRPREAAVNILDDTFCDTTDPYRAFEPPSMLCAGFSAPAADTAGTCPGDSGAPLTVTAADGSTRLLGVASWGFDPTCATGPDVYSELPAVSAPLLEAAALDPVAPLAAPALVRIEPVAAGAAAGVTLVADAGQLATRYTVEYRSRGVTPRIVTGVLGGGRAVRRSVPLVGVTGARRYRVHVTLTNALGTVTRRARVRAR